MSSLPDLSPLVREISASQTWPLRQRVMYPDKDIMQVALPDDESGIHYGVFLGNQLVSVVSLFVRENEGQFRKFATDVSRQNQGYGTVLLRHLVHEAQKRKLSSLWCNARVSAAPFYRKFGLREIAEPYRQGEIDYVRMAKRM
jgi:GNAT superfamily N-acetyltransferase